MSLKLDIEEYPEAWSKEIVAAVEDLKNGKRNAKRNLRKFVNREISQYYYEKLIDRYKDVPQEPYKMSNTTKNLIVLGAFIFILICTYIFNTSAHSGRTDAYGGHWNRSTGTYHYHSGGVVSKSYNTGPAPNDRYDDGYDAGYDNGHDEGWDTGYKAGYKTGHDTGHKKGYKEGDEYKSPHDIALMIYSPISIIAILALCIKAFKK